MITYCVTISIDKRIEKDWLVWMRESHIPAVMETGYFSRFVLSKILEPTDEAPRTAYSIHYFCDSIQDYHAYKKYAVPQLQLEHNERYGKHFSATRIVFKQIE